MSFENLIDYYIPSPWRPSKGSGAPRTESVDSTLKIKLWRQPVYYKYITSYYDVNNDSVFQYSKSNITSWTMYDHTLNKISNEYFFNNENYIQIFHLIIFFL